MVVKGVMVVMVVKGVMVVMVKGWRCTITNLHGDVVPGDPRVSLWFCGHLTTSWGEGAT